MLCCIKSDSVYDLVSLKALTLLLHWNDNDVIQKKSKSIFSVLPSSWMSHDDVHDIAISKQIHLLNTEKTSLNLFTDEHVMH